MLVSIVIALGVSEIASSWGRLLRNRARVRFYWLHAFWCAFTIVLMIQFWWGFWEFRDVASWPFPWLFAVVAEALVLILAAMLLLPNADGMKPFDLRSHYFDNSRPFFVLGGILIAQLTLVDCLVVAGFAATYPSERLDVGIAAMASALLLGFAAFSFSR